jgi:electron transfer flavoprotein beta subunit
LRIKEQFKEGVVTVLTVAPEMGIEVLRTALALGADQAIHMKHPAFADGDNYTTAVALTAALSKGNYDIIFFGKHAIDDDSGAVGIYVAEWMGIPHVAMVNHLTIDPDKKKAVAHRQIEGGIEVVETSLPAIFTCQKGLNEPRYATLQGIMKAKTKPITVFTPADLGLAEDRVGKMGAKIVIEQLAPPKAKEKGKILEGAPDTVAAELVRLLHEEAKVI